MVTPKGSISIGRKSLQVFCVLGAVGYLQVSPLGGSRVETWLGHGIRKRSVSWNLPKLNQLWWCNRGFRPRTTQNHPRTNQLVSGTWNSGKVAACSFLCDGGPKPPLHRHNSLSFGKFQDTKRFLIACPRHVSSWLPPSGEICKYATAPWTRKIFERFSTYWYTPLRHDHSGYCTADVGNPKGTYK
jgi:hypothetical protein